ncbi:hypothetical protein TNCT_690131 [Trichonephila clavata]|uniref:Uncharacterized protein n=1 Tax=Trichonephila clavata TaxID=2740835 RepID=A0A8X6KRD7_TRICU|nr:hypothetical protein TNCT_690131 [Trichonephila clavata]
MKRNHPLSSSKEIIFIDSTASCETSCSTITILVSATKVGALLLAVMIHASQNGPSSLVNEEAVTTPNFSEHSTPSLDNATDETQPYTEERIMCCKGKILPNKRVICNIGFVIHQA